MSGQSTLPTADTRPTDRRAGFGIAVHRATCPYCGTEATASISIKRCHDCREWFEVLPVVGPHAARGAGA